MSKILKSVHRSAKQLHDTGHMNDLTMREFDALCLDPCPEFSAKDVALLGSAFRAQIVP
jgi:putative transcriptional regulator